MNDVTDALELSEVIAGLRGELEKAQIAGKDKGIKFGVEGVEIEVDVSVAKSVQGQAEAGVEVEAGDMSVLKYVVGTVTGKFSINGHGSYEKLATQRVKLMLSASELGEDGNQRNVNVRG